MFQPYPIFLGLRYALAPRGNRFASIVSGVALLGLTLGVAALIIVLSVMNGFERELRNRILSAIPHGILEHENGVLTEWPVLIEAVRRDQDIRGIAPFVGGKVMISVGARVQGATLNGVQPELEEAATGLADHMIEGDLSLLRDRGYGIVLGSLLARQLAVVPGDRVTVVLPRVAISAAGLTPRLRRFEVVGLFSVGAQVDSDTAYVHLGDAKRLFQRSDVQGVRIWFDDPELAPEKMAELHAKYPDYRVRDWTSMQGSLFAAIRNEKRMIGLLLLVIVAVAAFNIVSIMTMTVAEKRSAIAVLRTLGASRSQIMNVFITRGCAIGLCGILAGIGLGVPVALQVGDLVAWVERVLDFRVFNPSVYFITHMPSLLRWSDVIWIALTAGAFTLTATLYPAWRAAGVRPVELLNHD